MISMLNDVRQGKKRSLKVVKKGQFLGSTYIGDMVQRGAIKLHYVAMNEQIANVLTNPLARVKFEYFREKLGVLHIEVPSKGN